MSGHDEPVLLHGWKMGELVRAAARLSETLQRFAIIGGVAVAARLGRAHRATADLDTVTDDDASPTAIEILIHVSTPDPRAGNRFFLDGTKVEVIGTNAVADSDLHGLAERDVLFVAGHRWALETATPMELIAEDGTRARVAVAVPAALFAMKLHAILTRSPTGPMDKRVSDAADIIRLLNDLNVDGSLADAFASAPLDLARSVRAAASRLLVDGAPQIKRLLSVGAEEDRHIDLDVIAYLGSAFVDRIDERMAVDQ